MPNLPSVNANNISKLPSTSSTEDSVELLNLFTHYDEDQCAETVCMLLGIQRDTLNIYYTNQKNLPGGWPPITSLVNKIRMNILSSKSWHPKTSFNKNAGGYYLEIKNLINWGMKYATIQIKECLNKYKLPCTGRTKEECLPIITTHIADTYLEWITTNAVGDKEKAGINKCSKATKAIRSLLVEAQHMCYFFVGNQANTHLAKPSFKHPNLIITALNNTRKKKSIRQGGVSVTGKKIKQSDLLRGQVHAALTDKQLEPFTPWFLLRKTVDGVKSPPGRKYTKWPPDDEKVITKCMHQALLLSLIHI